MNQLVEEARAADAKVTEIFVNTVSVLWKPKKINYEQLIHMAFPNGPFGGDVRYTVTWMTPNGREGSLRKNESVDVVEGMMFDVANTDKS